MRDSFTVPNNVLSTSVGSVSSTRMFGPERSGPNAQMLRAANKSHSYLVWKNSLNCFLNICVDTKSNLISKYYYLLQPMLTTSFSMSSARPFSSGSAIIVSLFLNNRLYSVDITTIWKKNSLLIWRLSKTFQGRCLNNSLAKTNNWIRNFDVNLTEHFTHVVHTRVQIEFAGSQNHMLARFLDSSCKKRIRLVDFSQWIQHFRKLRWIDRLNCQLHDWFGVEFERTEDANLNDRQLKISNYKQLTTKKLTSSWS